MFVFAVVKSMVARSQEKGVVISNLSRRQLQRLLNPCILSTESSCRREHVTLVFEAELADLAS